MSDTLNGIIDVDVWKDHLERLDKENNSARKLNEFIFGEYFTKNTPVTRYGEFTSDTKKNYLTALAVLSQRDVRKDFDISKISNVKGFFKVRYGGKRYFDIYVKIKFNDPNQNSLTLHMPYYLGMDRYKSTYHDLKTPFELISAIKIFGYNTKHAYRALWYQYARMEVLRRKKRPTQKQRDLIKKLKYQLSVNKYELEPFKRAISRISKLRNGVDIINFVKGNKDHEYLKALRAVKLIKKFDKINQVLENEIDEILSIEN
jgi:hypothetical protein